MVWGICAVRRLPEPPDRRPDRDERLRAGCDDSRDFDESPEGERVRPQELASGVGVSRALERLIKLRRLDRPATNDGDEWAAVDEPNATNEPTAVEENVTNEPTAIEENATNEPTAVEENVTNEPTAIEENATNEPTAVGENATNEPTAASQWLLVTSGNPRAVATKVGQAFQPDVRYVRLESLT